MRNQRRAHNRYCSVHPVSMRIRVAVMNFGQAVEKKPSVSEARPLEGIRLALSIRTTRTGCPLDSTL